MKKTLLATALLGALAPPAANAWAHDHDAVAAGVLGFVLGQATAPRSYTYYDGPRYYAPPPDVVIIRRRYAPPPGWVYRYHRGRRHFHHHHWRRHGHRGWGHRGWGHRWDDDD